MIAGSTARIPSFDGTELAVHRLGSGRPVMLLHGLFSSAEMNWIRFGSYCFTNAFHTGMNRTQGLHQLAHTSISRYLPL